VPQFPVNSHRLDPYTNFKFLVKIDTVVVAGLSKMSALKRTTDVIDWREAGSNSITTKLPGPTKYEGVTLERGLTQDTAFIDWANQVSNPQGDKNVSLKNFRKEVTVQVLNLQGVPVMAFILSRAWPSEFTALPELDANAKAVAIQSVKFEYEGFQIDPSVKEQPET
jgi:phage tail-like protein